MNAASEVSFHILRFALQRVQDGDLGAALELGFTLEEIRGMEQLTLKDLSHLSRLSGHFLRMQVDHDTYRTMLNRVREEAHSEALQDALLQAGAPRSLMADLFGWGALQYAQRRKLLGVQSPCGRPGKPTEAQEQNIWDLWQAHQHHPLAQRYLETAQAAQVSVGMVVHLLQAWEQAGLMPSDH
ncbi:hypothetical protein M911_07870 [Ectothiorhodospira haloalkaliphila]|uniref:DUF2857 domain-containing protein n=1 Tax=Ectothiorhodospira haloalkaliphila TaxID=421628 RepID=W8KU39_9GAMM|nr:DUF2857 domain-containing protein [Ectothiorhodospira haloalkaliphila]AHK79086.1 hypothetical protein M911_07870 [Ectothiorhodospira haloalkaliphila]MCG5526401.1 DUF2857 domain-containing protein [Ectothiorhodospira haloalkaliphila]